MKSTPGLSPVHKIICYVDLSGKIGGFKIIRFLFVRIKIFVERIDPWLTFWEGTVNCHC